MTSPKPQYTVWQAISAAIALATRALDEVRSLARLPGPPGERGEKGEPGFSLDDFQYDGERRFIFESKGTKRIFVLPIPIYRGVWKNEQDYERGDITTVGGSTWHAQTDSKGVRPGNGSKAWQLSVKCGRDGKDGQSIMGPAGPPGKDGRDLTQLGTDGAKW